MQERNILDLVPVDYCSNLILAATVHTATQAKGTFNIVHSSTGGTNPSYIKDIIKIIKENLSFNPSTK